MSATQRLEIKRVKGTPTTVTEVIHSPDDGGHYISQTALLSGRSRISADVYDSFFTAKCAYISKSVKWGKWS